MAQYYPSDDLYLNIARGLVKGTSFNHKFGAVPQLSISTAGTVWDVNDTLYPWSALDTPAVVNVERTNIADEGHNVTVQGLDSDWNFQEETITITGANTLGTKLFRRVNRVFCTDAGSYNVGNINIEAGAAGGTVVARITAAKGQTLMSVYTVPAGYTAYITHLNTSVQNSGGAECNMFVRYSDQNTFRVAHSYQCSGAGGNYSNNFTVPLVIPEKSDIDMRATASVNNSRITTTFDIISIKAGLS